MLEPADLYILIIVATCVLLLLLLTIVSIIFIYQNRQIKADMEVQRVKENLQSEILKAKLEIKERTLKNISQEIHDNVGQILSLANITLTAIDPANAQETENAVNNSMELVSKALKDLRNLSKTLDPDNIGELGLEECLKFEIGLIKNTGRFNTALDISCDCTKLDNYKQLFIYRIVQEAIHNVLKHAHATTLSVVLKPLSQSLLLEISDNGRGFIFSNGKTVNSGKFGAGLRNMNYRAGLLHGKLDVITFPDKGTTVRLEIPN